VSEAPAAQAALDALQAEMRACRRCIEAGYAVQGPAVFSGPATAQVMIIGQAPAQIDLQHGSRPWSGAGGRRLMGWLARAGFSEDDLRQKQYMAALTRCFPGKHPSGRGDRAPTPAERRLCAPYLERELSLIRPRLIIAVGKLAIERFLGAGGLAGRVGQVYRVDVGELAGVWVAPLPHPSGASLWLNRPQNLALVEQALARLAQVRHDLGL
jgi:uracil-DNA glycosylase